MGKKQAITARKDAPVAAEEVKWKAYFSEIGALASEGDAEQRDAAMAKVVKAQAERIIQAMLSTEVNSITDHRLFVSLGVAELVSAISALDETAVNTPRVVVGVAHALTAAPPEFSGVLAEHVGFVEALTKLQKKVSDLTHPLSQSVLLALWMLVTRCCERYEDLPFLAKKPSLLELVVGYIVFLGVMPSYLHTRDGLAAALRCVRIGYELSKQPTPAGRAVRAYLVHADVPRRLLGLFVQPAAGVLDGDSPASTSGSEAAQGEASAASPSSTAAGSADVASTSSSSTMQALLSIGPLREAHAKLLLMGLSFVSSLMGLGTNSQVDISAAGLAPLRKWLLAPGIAEAFRAPLQQLLEQCLSLSAAMAAAVPSSSSKVDEASSSSTASSRLSGEELERAKQFYELTESALRNVCVLMLLPTVIRGANADEFSDGINFVIQYFYALHTEGVSDVFAAMHAAASGGQLMGDYTPFLGAAAAHFSQVLPVVGPQMAQWGVVFKRLAAGTPQMQVGEGVDEAAAHGWLTGLTPKVLEWGQQAMHAMALSSKAASARMREVEGAVAAARKARETQKQQQEQIQQGQGSEGGEGKDEGAGSEKDAEAVAAGVAALKV